MSRNTSLKRFLSTMQCSGSSEPTQSLFSASAQHDSYRTAVPGVAVCLRSPPLPLSPHTLFIFYVGCVYTTAVVVVPYQCEHDNVLCDAVIHATSASRVSKAISTSEMRGKYKAERICHVPSSTATGASKPEFTVLTVNSILGSEP